MIVALRFKPYISFCLSRFSHIGWKPSQVVVEVEFFSIEERNYKTNVKLFDFKRVQFEMHAHLHTYPFKEFDHMIVKGNIITLYF